MLSWAQTTEAVLGGKGFCIGDSGGPVVQYPSNYKPKQEVLLGIIRFGYGCPTKNNVPQIATRVKYFVPWLQHIVPNLELRSAP